MKKDGTLYLPIGLLLCCWLLCLRLIPLSPPDFQAKLARYDKMGPRPGYINLVAEVSYLAHKPPADRGILYDVLVVNRIWYNSSKYSVLPGTVMWVLRHKRCETLTKGVPTMMPLNIYEFYPEERVYTGAYLREEDSVGCKIVRW